MTIIITNTFKMHLYAGLAGALWLLCSGIVIGDVLEDGAIGRGVLLASFLSVPSATLTVLAWLQCHLPALSAAFDAGVATGELKRERRTVVPLQSIND